MTLQVADEDVLVPVVLSKDFEGRQIDTVQVQILKLTTVDGNVPRFKIGDRIRIVAELECVGVDHTYDKNGDLVRTQKVMPYQVDMAAWTDDPDDDGVQR